MTVKDLLEILKSAELAYGSELTVSYESKDERTDIEDVHIEVGEKQIVLV